MKIKSNVRVYANHEAAINRAYTDPNTVEAVMSYMNDCSFTEIVGPILDKWGRNKYDTFTKAWAPSVAIVTTELSKLFPEYVIATIELSKLFPEYVFEVHNIDDEGNEWIVYAENGNHYISEPLKVIPPFNPMTMALAKD